MSAKRGVRAVLAAAIAATFGAIAPGCNPSAGSFCRKVCECSVCDEDQRAECIDSVDDGRRAAENKGCDAEFDDYLGCANSAATCTGSEASFAGCESEANALYECAGPIGIGASPCELATEQIVAHAEECGLDIGDPGGQDVDCTPELGKQSLCAAGCFTAASCGAFNGTDSDATDEYINCVSGCGF